VTTRELTDAGIGLNMNSRLIALIVLGLNAAGLSTCTGQSPEFIRATTIGSDYFGLSIRAGTNGWATLEASPDLHAWNEVASIATTNDVRLFVDEVNVDVGNRFYRLRLPGTTAEEAEARWLASKMAAYRFQLERVSTTQPPHALTGIVSVRGDEKSVTNAIADGQPVDRADPADFPRIEELFSMLRSAQRDGCRQVYALYDSALGFPTRCLIDQRIAVVPPADVGNALSYRVTGLESLEQSTSANQLGGRNGSQSAEPPPTNRATAAAAVCPGR
jgi:hypothetical protein